MEDEVMKLRAYIAAHVASLNMRLLTQGLTSAALASAQSGVDRQAVLVEFSEARHVSVDIKARLDSHHVSLVGTNTLLHKLIGFVTGELSERLQALLDLANKIWRLNARVMDFIGKIETNVQRPDTGYTWLQDPIRFEDVLGRLLPVPSEYSWGMLDAIIREQFVRGPGSQKIKSGEYELHVDDDDSKELPCPESGFTPGMRIIMTVILGRYGASTAKRCPRVGCDSTDSEKLSTVSISWSL